ncbi:hypothetical protein ScPMuIL_018346 [Solemya velum]
MAPAPENDKADDADQTKRDDDCLARSRSKRQRPDKTGRFAALEKLKKAKEAGGKNKYEVEEELIYDIVDENEYSKIVRQRQEEDWIVDDDGGGYVEDGREIFDDDMADGALSNQKKGEKKKKNPNIARPGTKPKKDIKAMFMAQSVSSSKRKTEKDVSLVNDDLFGDIMEELHKGPSQDLIKPGAVKLTKKKTVNSNKSPYNPFSTTKKPPSVQPVSDASKKVKTEQHHMANVKSLATKQKTLPKPLLSEIKKEEEESPDIQDFESMEQDIVENVTADNMDLNDINFDEDVDELKMSQGKKAHNATAVKVEKKENIPVETVSTGWNSYSDSQVQLDVSDVQVDSSQLPFTTTEQGEQVLRLYWLDAYEDAYKTPGTVYLFGKVWIESAKTYVSCCVTVKNIERRLYLLPRPTKVCLKTGEDTGFEVSMMDVYTEFNEKVAEKNKIMKFKSMPISRHYAFDKPGVPVESEYLEVRYAPDLPQLPMDLKGETFSHVFGTNTSSLELLLIDRKMKGPGWLDIKCPQISSPPLSWCKLEIFLTKPDLLSVCNDASLGTPPLVTMTLTLQTLPNPKTHQNEIIGAACLTNSSFSMDKPAPKQQPFEQHFCVISKPNDCIFPFDFRDRVQKESKNMKIEVLPTERALLGFLLAKIHKIDPDLIVGHDVFGFELDVLLHRMSSNKVPHWSKIGRLKRSVMPKLSNHHGGRISFSERSAACGRLVCDVKISARELIRCRSYDLTELTSQILKQKRTELDYDQIKNMYCSSQQLLQLLELLLVDSTYQLRIMYELNAIPLALQITNVCGNVMSKTLMGGRAERNEYLLLHAFHEKKFIVPDKEYKKVTAIEADDDEHMNEGKSKKTGQGRRKPAYTGGLVLEPKKGFYDKFILLLDFNSLYPSIIQEYNICFTTISRMPEEKSENTEGDDLDLELPDPELEPGILPTEIRKLVESRKAVKVLMKDEKLTHEQYMQYDIRQKALKLTANSMYGCLGFTFSRFFAKSLAALITGKGREILMKTKDLVQAMNLEVIYGDTDSIMVNSNCTDLEQTFKLGNKIKTEVNKLFKLLEIDIDGVFKSMLLLKKKKYAALNVQKNSDGTYTTTEELKGLDIVRRDWCDLAKEAGKFIVSQILSGESRELILENIHSKLIDVGEKVKENDVPVEFYYITKQLTKNPEDYPDKKSLPHVQVALRLNSKGGKKLHAGDTIPYIICEDGSTLAASQRAYHPDELAKSETLKIDTKYYLASQVHPVVSRLCDPIEGTDAAHLAECLGLDPSGYKHASHHGEQDDDDAMLGGVQMSEEEKYKDCDRFKFKCPLDDCGREIIFDSVFIGADTAFDCSLAQCPNQQCQCVPNEHVQSIANQLVRNIRTHINQYYQGWLKCEDTACGARMRKVPLTFQRGHAICSVCHRGLMQPEYTESALYSQLCFYQYIFDMDKALITAGNIHTGKQKLKGFEYSYRFLKDTVDRWLKYDAYSEVNLNRLFEGLFLLK